MDNYIKQLREALHFVMVYLEGVYDSLVRDGMILEANDVKEAYDKAEEVLSLSAPSEISRSSVPRADYDRLAEKCERLEGWLKKIASFDPCKLNEQGEVLRISAIRALTGEKAGD